LAVNGKRPSKILVITIAEVFLHVRSACCGALRIGPADLAYLRWPKRSLTHAKSGETVSEVQAVIDHGIEQEPKSPFVFKSERAGPFTTAGFARMMERVGVEAGMPFKVHPTCWVTLALLP
jgi:hypothetical protein